MATKLKLGLLLPHFGDQASFDKILDGARKAEEYGFDSVWVRDHLVFEPHGMEGQDNTHYDCFVVLAAVAAVTKKIVLGLGTIIAHRHPIYSAQLLSSLSTLCGGRVICGVGQGNSAHEFEVEGLPFSNEDRFGLMKESVHIMRRLWSEGRVDHQGKYYSFENMESRPQPVQKIPIWYGGSSPASCRRAVDYCDGWLPGRIPLVTFQKLVNYLHSQCDKAGRPMLTTGAIPITTLARDPEAPLTEVNVKGLINEGNTNRPWWVKPASGTFSRIEDIEGMLLWGTPDDIAAVTWKYEEAGLDHLIYDLRYRFSDWDEQVDLLGQEVLPQLRK